MFRSLVALASSFGGLAVYIAIFFGMASPFALANGNMCIAALRGEVRAQALKLAEQSRQIAEMQDSLSQLVAGRKPVIQSLSVLVPADECVNKCPFCCSRMRDDRYQNVYQNDFQAFEQSFLKRMRFARSHAISTVILTGRNEPQQKREFLEFFARANRSLDDPFLKIEMQTTGVFLDDEYLRFLRDEVGVTTISLSTSALDSKLNNKWNGIAKVNHIDLDILTKKIVEMGFTLRMSLNLTKFYDTMSPEEIFARVKSYGTRQVTMRVFYESSFMSRQNRWIQSHRISEKKLAEIHKYIFENGKILGVLEYGAINYSLNGLSVVVDDDCMNKKQKANGVQKYWIVREDGHLYSQWDDPASLVF